MIILTIRTDKPEAEIGLFEDEKELIYESWEAHRQLAETIHGRIEIMLKSRNKTWADLEGIICFQGPGSFTGLRIGLTVANALAASIEIPVVGKEGNDWIVKGIESLLAGNNNGVVIPEYGSPVHITPPKS